VWAPPTAPPELGEYLLDDADIEAYRTRPARPWAQLLARAGLWTAVAFGCVGGGLSIVARPASTAPQVALPGPGDEVVPAPVAGVAELAVEAWLTADDDQDEALDALFVERPSTTPSNEDPLTVRRVTTVAGGRQADGYWTVTLAVDISEDPPIDEEGDPGSDAPPEPILSTWYVEVGIVGDDAGGLAALTTPAVLPGRPPVSDGWSATVSSSARLDADDPITTTVDGFLRALLADGGDPSRYLSPGYTVLPADPVPFLGLEVEEVSADELGDGRTRALVSAVGITPGGFTTALTYEVMLTPASGRWEVVQYSGAPMLVARPEPEPRAAGDEPQNTG